ncbi:MAG: hypothetical protein ACI8V8_002247, partial [Chitinophagales bacterium]
MAQLNPMKNLTPLLLLVALFACKTTPSSQGPSVEEISEHTLAFNTALDSIYDYQISLSPVSQTYEGLKENNDLWDVNNDSVELFYYNMSKKQLSFLKSFDTQLLDTQAQLTYRMYEEDVQESIYSYENWRNYYYPVNQMFGSHTWFPEFLMNVHTISNEKDALAWLSRLSKLNVKIDEVIVNLNKSEAKGIIAPKFVYPYVINDCKNLLQGAPFDENGVNPLINDFTNDVNSLEDLDEVQKQVLVDSAKILMLNVFQPAYTKLIAKLTELETISTEDAGVWKFENGDDYYLYRLARTTTTKYTPQEVFDIGMNEIDRIHSEMELIKAEVEFEGTLLEFFEFIKNKEDLYYPNTDEGREAYLTANIKIKEDMEARLDDLFITKPKAELEVRRVEPYREESAGTAFYNSPAPDGSRPGIYYANLHDMSQMPKYEMEALTYHEA